MPNTNHSSTTIRSNSSNITSSPVSTMVEPSSSLSQPPAATKGIAGRINYAEWDKVTNELVTQLEDDDQQEIMEETKKVRSCHCGAMYLVCRLFAFCSGRNSVVLSRISYVHSAARIVPLSTPSINNYQKIAGIGWKVRSIC
jgi:hypothetical protein